LKFSFDTSKVIPAFGRAIMGHGAFPGTGPSRKLALLESLIELTRPFLVVMGIPTVGMGAFLAAGLMPSPLALLSGVIAVVMAVSATHTFNDWVDRKRDIKVWPNRPLPAGRISAPLALLFAAALAAGSLAITAAAFGMIAFFVLLVAEILSFFYCVLTRDAIGRLSLPPIIAFFPLGGWAAVSPDTLFASPLPWFLAAIVVTWQTAHTTVKMPARPLKEVDGKKRCIDKALFFYPSPKAAAAIGFAFSVLLLIEVIVLGVMAELGLIYWLLAIPISAAMVLCSIGLLASSTDRKRAFLAFNTASLALTFISGGVCFDLLLRMHLDGFLLWILQASKDIIAWVELQAASLKTVAYWVVLVVAALVTLAVIGKVVKELTRKTPEPDGQASGD